MSFVQGIGVTPKGERYDRSFLVLDQSKKYKRTELGDFIYSSNNLETGSIGINKTGKAVISPVYSIFYGVSIGDSEFIGIMSLLPGFIAKMIRFRQGVVYGQWRIHEKDFLDISVSIPSVDERTKITKLILSIEELITLHQRKLEHLNLKKKALLQKLFPKNGERHPELRFPGFTDAWEQRKLGDYLSIPEKEILEVKSANDLLTVKLNLGGVELGASRDTLSLGSTVYYKRYAGQFIYGKQNFFNGSMGIIPQKLDGKGSSGDVPSFNISNIEANYLYAYVSRESYWRPKVAAASGTGSKRIHEKTLLDFNIDVPSINEQKLISNTFDLINRFITLHQRKLEHLQLQKKALLQQMFV